MNAIDIVVYYNEVNELLMEASLSALDSLAGDLESVSQESSYDLLESPLPKLPWADHYMGFLTRLSLVKDHGPLKIQRENNGLTIKGSPANCSILAYNLRFLYSEAFSEPSKLSVLQLHIEYFPNHPYLDAAADPLVVYIKMS